VKIVQFSLFFRHKTLFLTRKPLKNKPFAIYNEQFTIYMFIVSPTFHKKTYQQQGKQNESKNERQLPLIFA